MSRRGFSLTVGTLSGLAAAFLLVPLAALAVRTPWDRLPELWTHPAAAPALRVSLVASFLSLMVSVALGVPLAWVLARWELPGIRVLRTLVTLPMVLPPVVGGVALLAAFGRRGVLGRPLSELTGLSLPFTTPGVVMAITFVSLPFLVISTEGALRTAQRGLEEVAATLGARPFHVFLRVTLPLVAPGLGAGMALAWARALGEFGATITFAGNLPGRTQTLPLAVFLQLESDPDIAYLLSFLLLAVSAGVLLLARLQADR